MTLPSLQKKAQQLEMHLLITLIILAMLCGILFAYGHQKADEEGFRRQFVLKDTALLASTIVASPYETSYAYAVNVSDVLLSFRHQRVTLHDPRYPHALTPAGLEPYSIDADMDVSTPEQMHFADGDPVSLLFSKRPFLLSITEQDVSGALPATGAFGSSSCPKVSVPWDYDAKEVLIDAPVFSSGSDDVTRQMIRRAYEVADALAGTVRPVRSTYLAHKDLSTEQYLLHTLSAAKEKKVLLFIRPVEGVQTMISYQISAQKTAAYDAFTCLLAYELESAGLGPVSRASTFPAEYRDLAKAEAEYVLLIDVGDYERFSSRYVPFTDALEGTLRGFFP